MENIFFKTPLELLCGKDKLKIQTHYIYFLQEYIYVSNGSVALKQHMGLHGFNQKQMRRMDGMCIHKDIFKLIKKKSMEFKLPCIEVEFSKGIFDVIRIPYKPIYEVQGGKKFLEQINNSFNKFDMKEVKEIAINPDSVTLIRKTMVTESSGFTFRFNESNGGVLVTPNQNNIKEHAMIVPLLITGKLC